MATALHEQSATDAVGELGVEERLGLLLDREQAVRETRRMHTRLRKARLRQDGVVKDTNFPPAWPRQIPGAADCRLPRDQGSPQSGHHWANRFVNPILPAPLPTKPAGKGSTRSISASPSFFEDLSLAKGDGRYLKLLTAIAKTDRLVLDDYGLAPLNRDQRHDLLEILEDRHGRKFTMVTGPLPLELWHEQIGDPTMADTILD